MQRPAGLIRRAVFTAVAGRMQIFSSGKIGKSYMLFFIFVL